MSVLARQIGTTIQFEIQVKEISFRVCVIRICPFQLGYILNWQFWFVRRP